MIKTQLDAEKEELFAFVWLLPLVPLLAVFVFCLCNGHFSWVLLLIALFWFALWGYIYRNIQTEICLEGEKITLKLKRKIYIVSITDIMYIEEYSSLTKPLKTHTYKIYMQPIVKIPSAHLLVRNKKIQKNFSQLFPNIPVKKNIVLD